MRRIAAIFAFAIAVASQPRPAEACGGYFPPTPPAGQTISVATDHRIVVAIADTLVTVWDQVEFSGDPRAFAWVMPIRGRVAVGVGSDDFLQQADDKSSLVVHAPPRYCPAPSGCGGAGCAASSSDSVGPNPDTGDTGVIELGRSVIGDYLQVQIRSTDETAILSWLASQKFVVDAALKPVFAKYVKEGYDFLAVRLDNPKSGIKAMRPIRVSWGRTAKEPVSIPLRMAAAGISTSVGIKLVIFGDRRWKPENYPSYVVPPSQLTWDFDKRLSDYTEARARAAEPFAGRAFALESSAMLTKASLGDIASGGGIDAGALVDMGPTDTGSPPDTGSADTGTLPPDADGDADGSVADAASDAAEAAVDTAPPFDAGEPPAISPSASDLEIAYGTYSTRRVTRYYGKLPATYLDQDLRLVEDEVQSELNRIVVADRTTGTPVCGGATIAGDARTAGLELGWLVALAAGAVVVARRASRTQ